MTNSKLSYKFGLYGRCPVCKDIDQEICEGCGATEAFTDSSKPGIVVCAECNLEHSIKCDKPGCGNQVKVLRTPKNNDEKSRIDEFIYRKKNKDMDKRVFVIKEKPQVTVIKEVKVSAEELKKKQFEDIISLDPEIDMDIIDETKKPIFERASYIEDSTAEKTIEKPVEKKVISKAQIDEQEPIISLKDEKSKLDPAPLTSREPTVEEKQELDKIKSFWKSKEVNEDEEKKEEERRIVNQFYDEQEDDALDKKINFENIYNETAYFDCRVCGKEEQKILCDKCGQSNQFSLNYDAISCKCSNDIKVKTCDCGAKHGHSDFYLVSDGIKWQYSKSKSYYNYRKGRMLSFSTCPTCVVFSVEKCKVCGSKVNFGFPNKNNEVYCKNCGSVNQYMCENRNCNDSVKSLRNPNSIEQQLDWLNEVMNFKSRISGDKVKYSEPGSVKKPKDQPKSGSYEISIGNDSTPDFSNSFIEEFDSKTKEIITTSFITEVENEVNQRKKLQEELRNYNKTQATNSSPNSKPTFGAPAGTKPVSSSFSRDSEDEEISSGKEIMFDDSGKSSTYYIIIIVIVLAVAVGAWWGYSSLTKNDNIEEKQAVEVSSAPVITPKAAEPVTPKAAEPVTPKAVEPVAPKAAEPVAPKDTNAAQTYIDGQKENIEKAKEAVEKNQKAQDDMLKEIDGL